MSEWGNPTVDIRSSLAEYIGREKRTGGSEPSQYPEEEKTNSDSLSSGERNGNSLNRSRVKPASVARGCRGIDRIRLQRRREVKNLIR